MRTAHMVREDLLNPHRESEYDLFVEAFDLTNELSDPDDISWYDEEEDEFRVNALPASVQQAFSKAKSAPILWPNVVQKAIDAGIRTADVLANIPFFLHHQDRLNRADTVGRPISKSEPDYGTLSEEWLGWRDLVRGMLKEKPVSPSTKSSGVSELINANRQKFGITADLERLAADFYKSKTKTLRAIDPGNIGQFLPLMRSHKDHIEYSVSLLRSTTLHGYLSAEDVPLVVALGTRESGKTIFRTDAEAVVSAGKDTHSTGVSGLDYLYNLKRYFSEAGVRIHQVKKDELKPGREDRNPGVIEARHLLFSHMVKTGNDEKTFRQRHIRLALESVGLRAETDLYYRELKKNARRMWLSLYYSGPGILLQTLKDLVKAINKRNESIDLNRVLSLPISDFQHKPRVILARATSLRAYIIEKAS